jgi:RNA polymerase sigma-70 factor, ECF subfamily
LPVTPPILGAGCHWRLFSILITTEGGQGQEIGVPSRAASPYARLSDRSNAGRSGWTFDSVYETHCAFVSQSARRLGIMESVVDDVVQDVFLVVHRRLPEFDGAAVAVRSWLLSIVIRVARDKRRSIRRKPANIGSPSRVADDVDSVPDRDPRGPHEAAVKAEAVRALHTILNAMPDTRREVFILAELEQMSAPEIAGAVGAKVNTVYSRLRAARADFDRAAARVRARARP